MPDSTGAPLDPVFERLIQELKDGDLNDLDGAREVISASKDMDGDHFGIPDARWQAIERFVVSESRKREAEQTEELRRRAALLGDEERRHRWANQLLHGPGQAQPRPAQPSSTLQPAQVQQASSDPERKERDQVLQDLFGSSQAATTGAADTQLSPAEGEQVQQASSDAERKERDQVLQDLFGSGQAATTGAADTLPSPAEGAVEVLSGPSMADAYSTPPAPPGNSSRLVWIGGGIVAVLLLVIAAVVAARLFGHSNPEPASSPAAAAHTETASAAPGTSQASASIGGIGENSTKSPAVVVCQIRGTALGMEFHGTLSGPNIGSSTFDVKTGQPSQGVPPASPDDAVFALAFPGTGGQNGGGPLGPFTCSLTSVDVPSGYQLAAHQPGDWTMTVT